MVQHLHLTRCFTRRGSPTSQKIVFRHVRKARQMSLSKVLEEDFRILHHMCHISKDFVEGIRAKLIDKDNNARWNPATIEEVKAVTSTHRHGSTFH